MDEEPSTNLKTMYFEIHDLILVIYIASESTDLSAFSLSSSVVSTCNIESNSIVFFLFNSFLKIFQLQMTYNTILVSGVHHSN